MEHNLKTGYEKTNFGNLADIIQMPQDMERSINNYDEEFRLIVKDMILFPQFCQKAKRIIVIGDTHGDFDITIRSLTVSNVIDKIIIGLLNLILLSFKLATKLIGADHTHMIVMMKELHIEMKHLILK